MDDHVHRMYERARAFPYDHREPVPDGPGVAEARAMLADLCDRSGVKGELGMVDPDVRAQIVRDLAAIIAAGGAAKGKHSRVKRALLRAVGALEALAMAGELGSLQALSDVRQYAAHEAREARKELG